jgi:hypothetical protein
MKVVCLPNFVQEALAQAGPVREGLSKVIRVAGDLGFAQLLNHQGIHLEKLHGKLDPDTRKPLYSMRATRSARIISAIDGEVLTLLHIEPDHDKAYR